MVNGLMRRLFTQGIRGRGGSLNSPSFIYFVSLILLLTGLVSCNSKNQAAKLVQDSTSAAQDVDSKLTFNTVTLEQADEQGRPFWQVKAKVATYSKDQKIAKVQQPNGVLFQDGKAVYQVTANQGEIQQDGQQLFLKGQIVATDPQNGIVLHGNELEWRPKEDLLIVRNQLTGTQQKIQVVAQEARVFSRQQRMELFGKVVANSSEPQLQMRTEHLIWQIKAEKLISDVKVQIDRFTNNILSDRATGNSAEVDLKTKIALLNQNSQLDVLDPPLQINGDFFTWNLNTEIIDTSKPLKVLQRTDQVAVTANQGRMNLKEKIVYLVGKVHGVGQRSQSLDAKTLTWNLTTQIVEALGDVVYRQVQPPLNFVGQKAVGNIQEENIVVSGGNNAGNRVVTEIIPNRK